MLAAECEGRKYSQGREEFRYKILVQKGHFLWFRTWLIHAQPGPG